MTLHPIAKFSKYPLIKTGVCMLTVNNLQDYR